MENINNERLTVTVREAAKALGCSHVSLYSAIASGEFTCVIRIGRRILIPKASLATMLATAGKES